MKKFILLAALLCASTFPLIALEGYDVQNFHTESEDKSETIDMMYTESTKNLVVIYKIKYKAFDESQAFIEVRDAIRKFADEHDFKHYKTYSDDIIKYHGKETELTRFIYLQK
jgi:hypothetical protein